MFTQIVNESAVLVDDQDAYLLSERKFFVTKTGYVAANSYDLTTRKRKTVLLHRLIVQPGPGLEIDHADGNKLNNTRENLRACTRSQNHANRRKFRNSSSQYKGVSFRKDLGKWACVMRIDGKLKYLGVFTCELDAARAYNSNAARLYGPFARLNTLPEGA